MRRFEDQTVIVTGGGRETGVSHARGFAAEGAKIVIAGALEEECRWLAREMGERALFTPLDVTNEEQWDATVPAAEQAFGPVSVLVNNAGITEFGTNTHVDPTSWRHTIDVNLTGLYLGIRAAARSMRKAGAGSIFGAAPSEWGVRGLTKAAALELGRDNIRVNSVHPGRVPAPMADEAQPTWRSQAPDWSPALQRSRSSSSSSRRATRASRAAPSSWSTTACSWARRSPAGPS